MTNERSNVVTPDAEAAERIAKAQAVYDAAQAVSEAAAAALRDAQVALCPIPIGALVAAGTGTGRRAYRVTHVRPYQYGDSSARIEFRLSGRRRLKNGELGVGVVDIWQGNLEVLPEDGIGRLEHGAGQ